MHQHAQNCIIKEDKVGAELSLESVENAAISTERHQKEERGPSRIRTGDSGFAIRNDPSITDCPIETYDEEPSSGASSGALLPIEFPQPLQSKSPDIGPSEQRDQLLRMWESDPDLALVVKMWGELSEQVKAQILSLVQADC